MSELNFQSELKQAAVSKPIVGGAQDLAEAAVGHSIGCGGVPNL